MPEPQTDPSIMIFDVTKVLPIATSAVVAPYERPVATISSGDARLHAASTSGVY